MLTRQNENGIDSFTSPIELQQKPAATKRVVLLGMLFVTFLVVSNLTAFKVAEIHLTKWIITMCTRNLIHSH